MKQFISALKFPVATLLIALSFIACDRDFSTLESDVLGENNSNFNTNESTLPIAAYNKKLERLRINGLASNLLGFFNDPAFGTTTASIVAQVVPSSFSPTFGLNPEIDSIAINIPYFSSAIGVDENGNTTYQLDSVYGSKDAPVKLSIYQNNYFLRDFNPGGGATSRQNYYSNTNNGLNAALTDDSAINFDEHVGELIFETINFTPTGNASFVGTVTDTTRSAPAFHAKLTSDEAKLFWKNTIFDKENDAVLSNASNFKNYFRGLYLKAEAINNNGQMALLNLGAANSNITIHYSYGEAESRLQSTYTLNFSGNILNTFVNNYTKTLEDGNPVDGDATLNLKGQAGSMAVIDLFPNGVKDFLDEYRVPDGNGGYAKNDNGNYILNRLINDVLLEVYEDESIPNPIDDNGDSFHKYDRIYAFDVKNNTPLIDYEFDQTGNSQTPLSSKFISLGIRDSISPTKAKYKIRITEHLKNILLRDSTNTKIGLVLSSNVNYTNNAKILNPNNEVTGVPAASIISPRGTVLYGSNHSDDEEKKMKLKIFYTEPK